MGPPRYHCANLLRTADSETNPFGEADFKIEEVY